VGYSVEVDQIETATWHELMDRFLDTAFYQTCEMDPGIALFGYARDSCGLLSHFH